MANLSNINNKFLVTTGGNVGIGTTSPGSKLTVSGPSSAASNTPSQAIVDIVGSSTAHLLMGTASASPYGAWINTDATGQPLILQGPGGNVGIGTTSPAFELQVGGTDVSGTASFSAQFAVLSEATTGYPSGFIFKAPRVATSSNRVLVNEDFGTYFSSQVYATSTAGAQSDIPIVFAPLGGNVGIGTTSPSVLLDARLSGTTGKITEFHNSVGYGIGFTVESDGGINTINSESNQALAFATNGASNERMRITSAGNVGIGSTSPQTKFVVQHTDGGTGIEFSMGATLSYLQCYNRTTNDYIALKIDGEDIRFGTNDGTERMRIDSSGQVEMFHSLVMNKTDGSYIKFEYNSATRGYLGSERQILSGGSEANMALGATGALAFATGGSLTERMRIDQTNGDVTIIASYSGSTYPFRVGHGTYASFTPTFVINDSGNVGIGTDSPTSPLTIKTNSGTSAESGLIIQANASTNAIVKLGERSNGRARLEMLDSGVTKTAFYTDGNNNYINAGNVGIGTSSPTRRFQVSGSIATNVTENVCRIEGGTWINSGGITIESTGANSASGRTTTIYSIDNQNQASPLGFGTGTTERMRINSNGTVGIGETGTTGRFVHIKSPSNFDGALKLECTNAAAGYWAGIEFKTPSDDASIYIQANDTSGKIYVNPSNSNRVVMGDFFKASNYGGYYSLAGSYHELVSNATGNWMLHMYNSAADPYGIRLKYSASPNNTHEIFYFDDGTQQRYYVTSAGAVYGNGTYGTISDIKLKENIVDATPKLDDINKLKVRNFNFKDKPEEKHIGFIAQELEEVFPKAIENTQDRDDDGKLIEDSYTKTIKSSILIPMLVKSIQELKADNDTLKARIETLENK